MSKTFNINIYKVSKAVNRDFPTILNLLDSMEQSMIKFKVYHPVRQLLSQIADTKIAIKSGLENAAKVREVKGRIE